MADPLSLTASVIAIATAAAHISRAISRMRGLKQMPAGVYALKNEVADLEVVLRQVGHALKQRTLVLDTDLEDLKKILTRTNDHLAELAKALERIADACDGGEGIKAIGRFAVWWKEKGHFKTLKDEIRGARETLTMMLGASNSRDLQHIMVELRRVTFLTSESGDAQEHYSGSISRTLDDQHLVLSTRIDQQYQSLSGRLDALGQFILSEKPHHNSVPYEMPTHSEKESDQWRKRPSVEALRVQISLRNPCRNWCPCTCHSKKMTIPGLMESLIGKMFVGYWFASMNLKLYFKYLPDVGPQLQLMTARRVPDTSQSIAFAMQGNIEGLKYLFTQGQASPRDVSDSRGYSLMRWVLYGGMHQYETVKFLITQGAIVDEESYDNVWDFVFRGKCNTREEQELRCITEAGERDWVEEQNFPLIHRVIFGLSSKPLLAELEDNPNAVYITDAQGRTALDWATARAQLDDIRLLLAHGADPNTMDATGRTTVLHAVDSHNNEALCLILNGGGNPNPKMPKSVFRSSPLTAAGFGGLSVMLRMLLDFGADPNACNPEGMTALHSVARTHNVQCALISLEFGADLNAVSSNGRTLLTTAIIYNNHQVLRLFVDRCYEYIMTARLKGPHLLPIIAEHADFETMSILASSHPLKLSYELSVDIRTTAQDLLRQRRDYSEKLGVAFEELVTIAQAEEANALSPVSLAESGLYFSARSSVHSELLEAQSQLNSARTSPVVASVGRASDTEDDNKGEEEEEDQDPEDVETTFYYAG